MCLKRYAYASTVCDGMEVLRIRHPAADQYLKLDYPDYDKEPAVHHSETTKKEKRVTKRQTIAAESFTRDFLDADIFGLFRMSTDSEPN